jgi:Right handed beta helix region
LAEQRTENPRVGGSIPPLATSTSARGTYEKSLDEKVTLHNKSHKTPSRIELVAERFKLLFCLWLSIQLTASALAGHLVVRHRGIYNSQTFYNGNPNTAAVDIETAEFVYFYNCTFESTGLALRAFAGNANVWIERCTFRLPGSDAIEIHNPARVIVAHSLIASARNAAVIADWQDSTTAPVTIAYNRIINCQHDGHAILINGLHFDPHIEIGWNEITNQYGQSKPADAINIYRSSGTTWSPDPDPRQLRPGRCSRFPESNRIHRKRHRYRWRYCRSGVGNIKRRDRPQPSSRLRDNGNRARDGS